MTQDTIDDLDDVTIRDGHHEWRTGHAPGTTLREYLTTHIANVEDPDAGDWGRVCRLVGLRRSGLDLTLEEAQNTPDGEIVLPDEHRC